MIKTRFWQFILISCMLISIAGVFYGELEFILPVLWGIWVYKKDIDEVLEPDTESNGYKTFPVMQELQEEELTNTQMIIYGLCYSILDDNRASECFELCDAFFVEARDVRSKCYWCGDNEITHEYCEDDGKHENDLVCTRCMVDYVLGVCETSH